jgi:hypothetical protein
MIDNSFDTRRHAMTVFTVQGAELSQASRGSSVRVFRNAPGTAIVQLRHDSEKRLTGVSASLGVDELKALRAMIDAAIADIQ